MAITRRTLLKNGAFAAGSLACTLASSTSLAIAQPTSVRPNLHKRKFIFAGGHPGDPEYGCGGTIATLTSQGHDVILLYLNDGAWPPTPAATRLAEAKHACELLKARPLYAGQTNGDAIVDHAHYNSYQAILQAEAPDAVFTHWPIDNHRDHRAISMLSYDAWQQSRQSFALYYYEVSDGEDTMQFSPNRYVDITSVEPIKKSACYAHASQTPDRYYALQDQTAKFRGFENNCLRAEAFVFQQQGPHDLLSTLTSRPTS